MLPVRWRAVRVLLEFDRGTEKRREYSAKLAAYYRYYSSGAFKRDYQTFPTLLVVTTSDQAEARFAYQAHLVGQRSGGTPITVLLTTTGRIGAHADGMLGPIWRGPGPPSVPDRVARVCWLPEHVARTYRSRMPWISSASR